MSRVQITRPGHPLGGRELQVLGRMRRHGRAELLLVLPDGSKSLIPAVWTDLHESGSDAAEQATLGSLADLLACHELVSALAARVAEAAGGQQAARQSPCKEDCRAACATQSDTRAGADATESADRRASRTSAGRGGGATGRADRQSHRPGARKGDRR